VYENDALQFFNQPEGYVEPDGGAYNYVYQFKPTNQLLKFSAGVLIPETNTSSKIEFIKL